MSGPLMLGLAVSLGGVLFDPFLLLPGVALICLDVLVRR